MQGEMEKKNLQISVAGGYRDADYEIRLFILAHSPQYEIQLNYLMSLTVIIATYKTHRKRRHAVTMV